MSEMRHGLRHFLNVGKADEAKYALMGDGITALTEEMNPESSTKTYIHEEEATTNITGYAPSIQVDKEYIKNEELQEYIDSFVDTLPTGDDAKTDYVRINIFKAPTSGTVYPAVKRACSVQINNVGGDGGTELMTGFTLSGIGKGEAGYFDTSSNEFTTSAPTA